MKEVKDKITKEIKQKIIEHKPWFEKLTDNIADHIIIAFIMLIILVIITVVASFISIEVFLITSVVLSLFSVLIAVSFLRRGIKYLFNNKGNISQLFTGYILAVIGIMFLFTTVYSVAYELDSGYLKYGQCNNTPVNFQTINSDPQRVNSVGETFYFSASTFFTIGYGDICPMGVNRGIAVLNGFFGSVFSTIVLAIAISKYLEHERK